MNEQHYSNLVATMPVANALHQFSKPEDIAAFYQSITENASDGVNILDQLFRYKYISKSAFTLFGYDADEMNLLEPFELTHPDDLQFVISEVQKCLENPEYTPTIEYRFRKKDGDWLWIESKFSNLFSNPVVNGLVINFKDISERKANFEKLKFITDLQSAIIEIGSRFMNASISDVDKQKNDALEILGRLIEADRTYIFSYDFNTKIAVNTHEWCNEGIESQISNLQNVPLDAMGYWPAKHAAGEVIEIEDMNLEQDEDVKKALSEQGIKSIIALPIMIQANCIGFVGIDSVNKLKIFDVHVINILKLFAQQISDFYKKQDAELLLVTNEARYRLTQEIGAIGSWEYCIRDDSYWNSHQLRKLFGVENNATTDFNEINDLIQSTICNPNPVNQALANLVNEGKPYEIEFEIIRHNDGEKRFLYSYARLVPDVENTCNIVRGIVRDITEDRKKEQKLKKSEALLAATLLHSRFSIFSIDTNYNLLYANEKFINEYKITFGIDLRIGESMLSFIPDLIKNTWIEIYDKALSNNAFVIEVPVILNNIEVYTEISATPILVDGEVIGASFYGENITERKVAEQNIIQNAVNLRKILNVSNQFVKPKAYQINFDEVTSVLSELSGAKYVVFNRIFADYSLSVSISGLEKTRETILKYLGVDFVNNKWKREEAFDSKWIKNKLTVLPDLGTILFTNFKLSVVQLIISKFNIGKVAVVRIEGNDRVVGNLIFIFEKGKEIVNTELIEIFTFQLGQYIERLNAEEELSKKMNEMERFHKLTVNRELNMIELKKEVNALLRKMGQEEKYRIVM